MKKRDDTKIYVIFNRHKGSKRNGRQKDVVVNRKKVSHASDKEKKKGLNRLIPKDINIINSMTDHSVYEVTKKTCFGHHIFLRARNLMETGCCGNAYSLNKGLKDGNTIINPKFFLILNVLFKFLRDDVDHSDEFKRNKNK